MGCCLSRNSDKLIPSKDSDSNLSENSSQSEKLPIVLRNKNQKKILSKFSILKTYKKKSNGSIYLVKEKRTMKYKIIEEIHKYKKNWSDIISEQLNIFQSLDHPNIIKIFQIVETRAKVYLIREYCSGGGLLERIIKAKQISKNQVAKYIRDILDVVNYCHGKDIAIQDLNPGHILFDSKDDNANIKVVVGKLKEKNFFKKSVTDTCYLAPEIFEGEYGKEADIWSCGVILCTLIFGRPPFHGKTRKKVIESINKGLNITDKVWPDISDELKDLISKMLEKNPVLRISAREALEHPWIKSRSTNEVPDRACAVEVLSRLSKFNAKSQIQKSILNFVSYHTTSAREEKELKETFKSIDEDGDGKLSSDEIYKAFKIMRLGSKEETDSVMAACDNDRSGYIDYSEFITGVIQWDKKIHKKQLREIFKNFDVNGDGLLSIEELKECVVGVKGEEWENFLDDMNIEKDHLISASELEAYFQSKFTEN